MKKSAKKSAKKKSWFVRFLVVLLVLLVLAGGGGYFFVTSWIQKYLRSDECRVMLARQIGQAAQAQCELDPLSWSGSTVFSPKLALKHERTAGWETVVADSVRITLDWSGVRRSVWSIPTITLDSLEMNLADAKKASASPTHAENTTVPTDETTPAPSVPGWLQGWIPKKIEIGEILVDSFAVLPAAPGAGVTISGMKLRATPAADEGAWQLRGTDGKLALPGMKEPFRMSKAGARIDARALALNDALAHWLGESEITAHGILPFGNEKPWSFSGHVANLDLKHVLSDDWKTNLTGSAEGDFETSGAPGADVLFKGKLNVKSGSVQNLFMQNLIADFTKTERFRRVVWDEAHADFEAQGERIRVSNIVLQSNGLVRVEGNLSMQGEALDGTFLVGISPETLRWKGDIVADTASGTVKRIFTDPHPSGQPGFLWTTVRVSGTRGAIKEDLTGRLEIALGLAIAEVPLHIAGKSAEVLGNAGGTILKDGAGRLPEVVVPVLEQGLGQGLDVLKGMKGLIPGLPK